MPKWAWEGQFGIGQESTWGTPVTIVDFMDHASGEFEQGDEVHVSRQVHGSRDRLLRDTAQGRRRVGFSVGFDMYYKGLFATLCKHAFGFVTTSNPFAGVYQHIISRLDPLPAGLTAEFKLAPDFYKLPGFRVNEIVFEGDAAGPLRMMVNGFAKDYTISASGATYTPPSGLNGLLAMFHQSSFTIDAVAKQYRSFRIRVFNDMFNEDFRGGGTSRLVYSLDPRDWVVEGSVVLTADENAQLLKIRDFQTAALVWSFVGPVIAGAHNYTWTFDLPKVRYRPTRRRMEGPNGESLVELEFEGFRDSAEAFGITTKNDQATI